MALHRTPSTPGRPIALSLLAFHPLTAYPLTLLLCCPRTLFLPSHLLSLTIKQTPTPTLNANLLNQTVQDPEEEELGACDLQRASAAQRVHNASQSTPDKEAL